ncbi:MAG: sodium/glutamate symporter, partial [Bacillota bacterium]|nr:sodium/glutamate symporter [Bacillota bacterium]
MLFETLEGVFTIQLDSLFTLAFAGVLLVLGFAIRNRVGFLQKFVIPAPVVGGFLFMFITWAGHATGSFSFTFENIYQSFFMLAFFTTVGLGASYKLLIKGGKLLIIYWLIAGIISIIQNTLGITIAKIIGLEPPYALLASAISMIGGHGAAGAYGETFAEMGYAQGPLVGAAAATFGLISAVLIGGPLGARLIEKHNLKPDEDENFDTSAQDVNVASTEKLTYLDVIKNVVVIWFYNICGGIEKYPLTDIF